MAITADTKKEGGQTPPIKPATTPSAPTPGAEGAKVGTEPTTTNPPPSPDLRSVVSKEHTDPLAKTTGEDNDGSEGGNTPPPPPVPPGKVAIVAEAKEATVSCAIQKNHECTIGFTKWELKKGTNRTLPKSVATILSQAGVVLMR